MGHTITARPKGVFGPRYSVFSQVPLTGTVQFTSSLLDETNKTKVLGFGTHFLTELDVGDAVTCGANTLDYTAKVKSIESDTQLHLVDDFNDQLTDLFFRTLQLTGTVTFTTESSTVTGIGTNFLALNPGDYIFVDSEYFPTPAEIKYGYYLTRKVASIESSTSLTLVDPVNLGLNYVTGSVTFTKNSTTLVGIGTSFTTELSIGQRIVVQFGYGNVPPDALPIDTTVVSITDDTHLVMADAATFTPYVFMPYSSNVSMIQDSYSVTNGLGFSSLATGEPIKLKFYYDVINGFYDFYWTTVASVQSDTELTVTDLPPSWAFDEQHLGNPIDLDIWDEGQPNQAFSAIAYINSLVDSATAYTKMLPTTSNCVNFILNLNSDAGILWKAIQDLLLDPQATTLYLRCVNAQGVFTPWCVSDFYANLTELSAATYTQFVNLHPEVETLIHTDRMIQIVGELSRGLDEDGRRKCTKIIGTNFSLGADSYRDFHDEDSRHSGPAFFAPSLVSMKDIWINKPYGHGVCVPSFYDCKMDNVKVTEVYPSSLANFGYPWYSSTGFKFSAILDSSDVYTDFYMNGDMKSYHAGVTRNDSLVDLAKDIIKLNWRLDSISIKNCYVDMQVPNPFTFDDYGWSVKSFSGALLGVGWDSNVAVDKSVFKNALTGTVVCGSIFLRENMRTNSNINKTSITACTFQDEKLSEKAGPYATTHLQIVNSFPVLGRKNDVVIRGNVFNANYMSQMMFGVGSCNLQLECCDNVLIENNSFYSGNFDTQVPHFQITEYPRYNLGVIQAFRHSGLVLPLAVWEGTNNTTVEAFAAQWGEKYPYSNNGNIKHNAHIGAAKVGIHLGMVSDITEPLPIKNFDIFRDDFTMFRPEIISVPWDPTGDIVLDTSTENCSVHLTIKDKATVVIDLGTNNSISIPPRVNHKKTATVPVAPEVNPASYAARKKVWFSRH